MKTWFQRDLFAGAAPHASASRYISTKHGKLCMNAKCDVEIMTNGNSTAITVRDGSLVEFYQ